MAMTNAERQAEYRKRQQRKASLEGLGARARDAAEKAIEAIWTSSKRRPDDATLEDFETVEQFRSHLAAVKPGGGSDLVGWCRDLVRYPADFSEGELKAVALVVEIADAIELTAYKPEKRSTRGAKS